ncbi:MAG TPA: hypothetical protein VHW23_36075 [Kofleriaceae bacterium]|nr:hypothetical protein [Kofleriaceae bacterium]
MAIALVAAASAARAAPGEPSGSAADAGSAAASAPRPAAGGPGIADGDRAALLDALGASDRGRLERAVAAIAAPGSAADADLRFAAARACEDRLEDPARALALYERIAREQPSARVAAAAARRAAALRELVGPHGESAALADQLTRLIAHADALPADEVLRTGDALAAAAWPGAPRAGLWLADWLRRSGHAADAAARYARVAARWPDRPEAREAMRGEAGCAIDARDWSRAETLAARLPAVEPADRGIRDELLAAARRGRRRARWYAVAWLALAGAFTALLGSLAEALLRGPPGTRRAALRPPLEVAYLAPIVAVLVGVAFTAHPLIAPAVTTISAGGVALAWLSGAALERLRAGDRPRRLRAAGHIVACLAGVAALAYIALTRDNLLDALIETVRFGPDP